jgi:hypothetical protein
LPEADAHANAMGQECERGILNIPGFGAVSANQWNLERAFPYEKTSHRGFVQIFVPMTQTLQGKLSATVI